MIKWLSVTRFRLKVSVIKLLAATPLLMASSVIARDRFGVTDHYYQGYSSSGSSDSIGLFLIVALIAGALIFFPAKSYADKTFKAGHENLGVLLTLLVWCGTPVLAFLVASWLLH